MESSCLDDRILQELAAGIGAPGSVDDEHFEHIAQCNRCGSRLKRYLTEFSDDLTPEENALLGTLKSSTPEGQKAILKSMVRSSVWMKLRQLVRWLTRPF